VKLVSISLFVILSAVACDKSDDKGGGAAGKATASAPAAAETVTIAQVGLKAKLPKGANISDGIGGNGAMIQAADVVVSVAPASEMSAKTVAEAKEEADMFSPKNLTSEELADGWVVTYENEGGMGTNYFLKVRRDIGGKAFTCDTTASKQSQRDRALAICKSLAK
jgi:hypothetical protein